MKDLRAVLSEFQEKLPREFVRVTREVDPKYEISAIIKKLDRSSPIMKEILRT
ncbi:MAG: hypothetical protein JRJ03_12010 [Deltaproteobacteria bacterium]|nr:hypothetical protein [Deltaproteobacteria bacterium]MBW2065637.1 hypothetical protein [Deltaproteobacteria bacterium]